MKHIHWEEKTEGNATEKFSFSWQEMHKLEVL